MKIIYTLWFLLFVLLANVDMNGQDKDDKYGLFFKNGTEYPTENLKSFTKSRQGYKAAIYNNSYYVILQFYNLPNRELKNELKNNDIHLYGYLPENAYIAKVGGDMIKHQLIRQNVRAIFVPESRHKTSLLLQQDELPAWAIKKSGYIDLNIMYYNNLGIDEIRHLLQSKNAEILKLSEKLHTAKIRIKTEAITQLGSTPWIIWVEPFSPPRQIKNREGKTLIRSNYINGKYNGARHLTGKGVHVGVWDSDSEEHLDLMGHIEILEAEDPGESHGVHVSGTLAGNGLLNPKAEGMAPEAQLYTWNFNYGKNNLSVFEEMDSSASEYGIVITQNSYGPQPYPDGYYDYTMEHYALDQLVYQEYPYLLHVFASGNEQQDRKLPFGSTISSSKNSVTVGAVDRYGEMTDFSSWGPVHDGRIKPDVCANGVQVLSTVSGNSYEYKDWYGTSMACPAVSGLAAQLVQRYRELNNDQNPDASLLKAIICNTANDIQNPGPDYQSGFGVANGRRALRVIEDKSWLTASVENKKTYSHSISVPSGIAKINVMLAWTDPEGIPFSGKALVNTLHLSVNHNNTSYLPWVLNKDLPWQDATTGIDNINNVQQVTIENPEAGNYEIEVNGDEIPFGPQGFAIVYAFEEKNLILTYPIGGEQLNPIDKEIIRWDATDVDGNIELAYSEDNGSWKTIANNIPVSQGYFEWTVPKIASSNVRLRIQQSGASEAINISDAFTIMGVTKGFVSIPSLNDIQLSWYPVEQATTYKIYKLDSGHIEYVTSTTDTSFLVEDLTSKDLSFYSVEAINSAKNAIGQRAPAVQVKKAAATDFGITSVEYPVNGDILLNNEHIKVKIANWGAVTISKGRKIPVWYIINNSEDTVKEEFITQTELLWGDTVEYEFSSTEDFSSLDSLWEINCFAKVSGDENPGNDGVHHSFINSQYISTYPYNESFDTFSQAENNNEGEIWLQDGWNNVANLDIVDWQVLKGATPSEGTGPVSDHTSGRGSYLYVEGSDLDYARKTAYLESPSFDLTELEAPEISFWYHMYAKDSVMGDLHIDVYSHDTKIWTNDIVEPLSGNYGSTWQYAQIPLEGLGERIKMRFRADTKNNFQNDISIDDVSVYESRKNDICVVGSMSPVSGQLFSSSESISILIQNTGTDTLPEETKINMNCILDDNLTLNEDFIITGGLAPNESVPVEFAGNIDLSDRNKRYSLSCFVSLQGDENVSNDSIKFSVQSYCEPSSALDNDGGIAAFHFHGIRKQSKQVNTTTGGYSFFNDSTTVHRGGTYNYTIESMDYNIYASVWIDFNQDGEFDLETELFTEAHHGRVEKVESSIKIPEDAKLGPTRLRVRTSYVKEDVTPPTPCKHHRLGETEDYTINITEMPDFDLSIVALNTPETESDYYTEYEFVDVSLSNLGKKSIGKDEKIQIYYVFDKSDTITNEITLKEDLQPNDTLTHEFTEAIDISGGAYHTLKIWFDYTDDKDPVNDSLTYKITNLSFLDWVKQNTSFGPSTGVDYISIAKDGTVWATSKIGATGYPGNEYTKSPVWTDAWWGGNIGDNRALRAAMIFGVNGQEAWVPMYSDNSFAVGGLFHTKDGGSTWEKIPDLFSHEDSWADIVYFWDEHNGMAMGDPIDGVFEIYTTSDGGTQWSKVEKQYIPVTKGNDEVGFIGTFAVGDDSTLWFGTSKGRIFSTADMGKKWIAYQTPCDTINDLALVDKDYGIVSEYDEELGYITYYTENGGKNWSSLNETGVIFPGRYCYVPETKDAFVSAGTSPDYTSGISYSEDKGNTWYYYPGQLFADQFLTVAFSDASTGYAGAYNTAIPPVKGGIWKYIGPPLGSTSFKSFSFPEQITETHIDSKNHEIHLAVSLTDDVSQLVASFEIAEGTSVEINGKLQKNGVTINDFSQPVVYTLINSKDQKQEWTINVSQAKVGIEDIDADAQIFHVYPNPACKEFYVKNAVNASIQLFDVSGNLIKFQDNVTSMTTVLLDNISSGLYLVKIIDNGKADVLKLLVR